MDSAGNWTRKNREREQQVEEKERDGVDPVTALIVGAVGVVGLAGWGISRLFSSSTSDSNDQRRKNDHLLGVGSSHGSTHDSTAVLNRKVLPFGYGSSVSDPDNEYNYQWRNDHIDAVQVKSSHGSTHDSATVRKVLPFGYGSSVSDYDNEDNYQRRIYHLGATEYEGSHVLTHGFRNSNGAGYGSSDSDSDDEDNNKINGGESSHNSTNDSARLKWKAPPSGEYMLNTDGSVNPKGAGYGAIIRDSNGDPVGAVAGKSEPGSILLHELQGVEAGLQLVRQLIPYKRIHISVDREEVVRYFYSPPKNIPIEVSGTWENIEFLKSQINIVKVEHNPEKTNNAADELSRIWPSEGKITLRPQEFGQWSQKLPKIIQEDKEGLQPAVSPYYRPPGLR